MLRVVLILASFVLIPASYAAPSGQFDCEGWMVLIKGHYVSVASPDMTFKASGEAKYHSLGSHEVLHLITEPGDPRIYLLTDAEGNWVFGAGPEIDPEGKGFKCRRFAGGSY